MNRPLLTIAIPTYNRAGLLDICVSSICDQIGPNTQLIEIIISNNAATDNTVDTVKDLQNRYEGIKYYENEINRLGDYNIARCFELATAKYVWVFSDDDLMLPGAIKNILELLQKNEYGVIFLKPTLYKFHIGQYIPQGGPFTYQIYEDANELLRKTHFWISFITGTITNKDLVLDSENLYRFEHSFLIQLGWVLPALFQAKQNVYVSSELILGRIAEVQNYKIFHVFATSFPRVLNGLATSKAIPPQTPDLLIDLIIEHYFRPHLDISYKYQHGENPLFILGRAFWKRKKFWGVILPLIIKRAGVKWAIILKRPFRYLVDKALLKINRRGKDVLRQEKTSASISLLKRFGEFSILPGAHSFINPQQVEIGHEVEAGSGFNVIARMEHAGEVYAPFISVGNKVIFGLDCQLDSCAGIYIGDYVLIGDRVTIVDNEPDENPADLSSHAPIYRKRRVRGPIIIGDKVLIEDGVRILSGVTIGAHSIIKAGSTVHDDVPPNSISYGNSLMTVNL